MCKYVVIDLEMCRVPKGIKRKEFGQARELIQIGAVLLDYALEISDCFMSFVRPEYGQVDPFIEKLTGIHNSDVADAPLAGSAIKSFFQWLPEDVRLVSWSDNDKNQLRAEIVNKGIIMPEFDRYFDEWIDCQVTFSKRVDNKRSYKLSEALNMSAIEYSDGEHDALVDAKNTALLFAKMERETELTLSPYLVRDEKQIFRYNPFAFLLQGTTAE